MQAVKKPSLAQRKRLADRLAQAERDVLEQERRVATARPPRSMGPEEVSPTGMYATSYSRSESGHPAAIQLSRFGANSRIAIALIAPQPFS